MNTKTCRLIDEYLVDFVEHKLPEDLKLSLQDHLAECPQCQQRIKDFTDLWGKIDPQLSQKPAVSLWPALAKTIKEYEAHPFRFSEIYRGFVRTLRPAVISLITVIGILFGIHLGDIPERSGGEPSQENLWSDISPEIYFSHYLEDFRDIPLASTAAFYLGEEKPEEDKLP